MPEGRSRTLLWILIGGGAFFLFVLAVFTLVYLTLHAGGTEAGFGGFGDRIGVVDLDGVILSPQPVVSELKKFGDDSSIKAIILHVNSPGGVARVTWSRARTAVPPRPYTLETAASVTAAVSVTAVAAIATRRSRLTGRPR